MPPGGPASPRLGAVANEATVRALLRAERPDLADRPLVPGPTGWDNAHWLLGDGLAVRLPRRDLAAPLVANEARVLREMSERLPLRVPVPVHVGAPLEGVWPWQWSVIAWFEGERVDLAYPPVDPVTHAIALGAFLRALHVTAPDDAPVNPYRGVPLSARAARTEAVLAALADADRIGESGVRQLRSAWEEGLDAQPYRGPAVWIHGDLHPGNQIAENGELTAVVDWGDAAGGDPATDLATAWWTLPTQAHAAFREAYGGVEAGTWARARGWAAALASFVLHEGGAVEDPALVATAHRTLTRL